MKNNITIEIENEENDINISKMENGKFKISCDNVSLILPKCVFDKLVKYKNGWRKITNDEIKII